MKRCLVSVVIPTAGTRKTLLQRAIGSALAGMPAGNVEVIAVKNGSAGPNVLDLGEFEGDPRVRVLCIEPAQANVARNAGLDVAVGEYVRFLDDDDYLDPVGAQAQYAAMQSSPAEVSTGAVRFVDEGNRETGHYIPGESRDFVAELLWQRPSTLPVAHVFSRDFLAGSRWDPACDYLQDVDWMHSLLRRGEVRWHPVRETVGTWYRHTGTRTSVDAARRLGEEALRRGGAIIEASVDALAAQGRLDAHRRRAAAKALWDYAHQGFSYSPRSWVRLARKALELDPESRPGSRLFSNWVVRHLDPIAAEWMLYPARAFVRRIGA